MEIQPIFSALCRHKIPATLIVLEIALACAVLCNAVFMIGHRVQDMRTANAIDESGLIDINVQGLDPAAVNADQPRNLAALQDISGVTAVGAINTVPLSNFGWTSVISTDPDKPQSAGTPAAGLYFVSAGAPQALGLRLLRGRLFHADEYADGKLTNDDVPGGHAVVLTRSLAGRLFPAAPALGKRVWLGRSNAYTVVGIVANVLRASQAGGPGPDSFAYSAFFPVAPAAAQNDYLVRTRPRERERVLRAAVAKIQALAPNAVVKGQTFTDIRHEYFASVRSMAWMLVQVCLVMLLVTAFSIVGLTSFWVGQRRRQIGVRRALGARRAQIAQYFQTENFLLSTAGVALGMLLAYGANLYLMAHYQLDRMPWYYLPASALVMWLLGQFAVLGPALRAANVPPVVATRSV